MGTQPIPYAPTPRRMQFTELVEINERMARLEQQVADMAATIAHLLPLQAKPGVVYKYKDGDGLYREKDPEVLEQLRAEGKGANIKEFRVPPRPDLGPTEARIVGYSGL